MHQQFINEGMSLGDIDLSVDLKQLEDGLHIISCAAAKSVGEQDFPVRHYGILDVGNTAKLSPENNALPILIHQTPPEIDVETFDYSEGWEFQETITGVQGAVIRLKKAFSDNEYDPLFNNCEQFVNYIKSGEKRSGQVEAAAIVGGVAITGFVGYKLLKGAGHLLGKLFKVG